MEPTFITDEIFITPGSGCKKHLKIKETRNYSFKTIAYCSRTKVKSSISDLKKFLCNPALGTNAWFKNYHLWELYYAWVLVIGLVLSTDVARSTMGLV